MSLFALLLSTAELEKYAASWEPGSIDLDKLIKCCPFVLTGEGKTGKPTVDSEMAQKSLEIKERG
jgi:hypothetical protein